MLRDLLPRRSSRARSHRANRLCGDDRLRRRLGYPTVIAGAENGRALLLGLDTGAARSSLSSRFFEVAGVRPTGARSRRIGRAGGFETVNVQILDTAAIRIDRWSLSFRDIDVLDANVTAALDLDGILGSDIAGNSALRIDFLNRRLDLVPQPVSNQ